MKDTPLIDLCISLHEYLHNMYDWDTSLETDKLLNFRLRSKGRHFNEIFRLEIEKGSNKNYGME